MLLYRAPLNEMAQRRLQVLRETNDGFVIAERDLELRGPGEVLGTRQTGSLQLRVADLLRDARLMPAIPELATALLKGSPLAVDGLIRRWLGDGTRYGQV